MSTLSFAQAAGAANRSEWADDLARHYLSEAKATATTTDRPKLTCKITPDAPCRLCGGTSGTGRDNAHLLCLVRAERGCPTPCLGLRCEACGGGGSRADLPGWPRCEVCGGCGSLPAAARDKTLTAEQLLLGEFALFARDAAEEKRLRGLLDTALDDAAARAVLTAVRKLAAAYDAEGAALEEYRQGPTSRGPEFESLRRARRASGEARDALDRMIELRAAEIAAVRNVAGDLAALIDAVELWYEQAEDGDRDMIADAEDLYRAVRAWHKGRARAEAACAPVLADSDDLERELVRVSHLATAPLSADLDDDGDIPEFLRQRQARANGGTA